MSERDKTVLCVAAGVGLAVAVPLSLWVVLHGSKPAERPDILLALAAVVGAPFNP